MRVVGYRRIRLGVTQHIQRHKRGPRSKSPGGYKKHGNVKGRRKQRSRR